MDEIYNMSTTLRRMTKDRGMRLKYEKYWRYLYSINVFIYVSIVIYMQYKIDDATWCMAWKALTRRDVWINMYYGLRWPSIGYMMSFLHSYVLTQRFHHPLHHLLPKRISQKSMSAVKFQVVPSNFRRIQIAIRTQKNTCWWTWPYVVQFNILA